MAYGFYRPIVIDHTKVIANLTDFPLLVSLTNARLKTTGNGGVVTSASGFDIIFSSTNSAADIIPFEIEKYDATTGEIIMWVKVAALSSSVDTTIYIIYGDASVTTSQEQVNAVWDSGYKGVYHLKGSGPSLVDSTSNGKNMSAAGTALTARTGQVDGGGDFANTGAAQQNTSFGTFSPPYTFELWTQLDASGISTLIAHTAGASDGSRLGAYNGGSGTVNFPFYSSLGVGGPNFTTLTFAQGDLVFIAVTVSASGLVAIAYLGSAAGVWSTETGVSSSPIGTPTALVLGAKGGGGGDILDGLEDEVRFSTVVRTAAWLQTQFNNQFSPSTFETLGAEVSSTLTVSVTDALTFTDGLALEVGIPLAFADAMAFVDDTPTAPVVIALLFSDVLTFLDAVIGAGDLTDIVTDSFAFSDAAALSLGFHISVGDAFAFTDHVANPDAGIDVPGFSDVLFFVDFADYSKTGSGASADAFAFSDSVLLLLSREIAVNDTIVFTDAVALDLANLIVLTRAVADTITFTDAVSYELSTSIISYLRRYLNDVPTP